MELSLTFLGIEFDSQLLFVNQLTSTAKNIESLLFSLKYAARTALKIPSGAFITMFIGAVIPKVLYGITCWSHALNSAPNYDHLRIDLTGTFSPPDRSPLTLSHIIHGTAAGDLKILNLFLIHIWKTIHSH